MWGAGSPLAEIVNGATPSARGLETPTRAEEMDAARQQLLSPEAASWFTPRTCKTADAPEDWLSRSADSAEERHTECFDLNIENITPEQSERLSSVTKDQVRAVSDFASSDI